MKMCGEVLRAADVVKAVFVPLVAVEKESVASHRGRKAMRL